MTPTPPGMETRRSTSPRVAPEQKSTASRRRGPPRPDPDHDGRLPRARKTQSLLLDESFSTLNESRVGCAFLDQSSMTSRTETLENSRIEGEMSSIVSLSVGAAYHGVVVAPPIGGLVIGGGNSSISSFPKEDDSVEIVMDNNSQRLDVSSSMGSVRLVAAADQEGVPCSPLLNKTDSFSIASNGELRIKEEFKMDDEDVKTLESMIDEIDNMLEKIDMEIVVLAKPMGNMVVVEDDVSTLGSMIDELDMSLKGIDLEISQLAAAKQETAMKPKDEMAVPHAETGVPPHAEFVLPEELQKAPPKQIEKIPNKRKWCRQRKTLLIAIVAAILGVVAAPIVIGILVSRNKANDAVTNQANPGMNQTTTVGSTPSEGSPTAVAAVPSSPPTAAPIQHQVGGIFCVDGQAAESGWNNGVTQGRNLTSGPMVGHITPSSAMIWAYAGAPFNMTACNVTAWSKSTCFDYASNITTSGTTVSVMYQRLRKDCPSLPVTVEMPSNQYMVQLTGLDPNTEYRYHVLVNGTKAGEMGSFRTAPLPQDAKKFRYMFGSCISFKRDGIQTIFSDVLRHNPAFQILNGDTVYADTTNYTKIWHYQMTQRSIKAFANIIRKVPTYATWDDHDYGPNNSDGLTEGKEDSLRAFMDIFANPSYGTASLPGIHSTWKYGDVQFFIVDNRYHRNEDSMYAGPEQMQWLKDGLTASDAVFKIIVHGGTIRRAGRESWFERSMSERRELMTFLAENGITGVLFHGGDVHNALMNKHPKCPFNGTAVDYEVYEIVSSGLSNGDGRYTIVDVDTSTSLPTITYTMYDGPNQSEKGVLTLLDGRIDAKAAGVMRHQVLQRNMTYPDCQLIRNPTYAYPIVEE